MLSGQEVSALLGSVLQTEHCTHQLVYVKDKQ